MTRPAKSKFSSSSEEGKYVIENVKNNRKFRENFFYGTGYYSLESIRNYITQCIRTSYGYKMDPMEFGTVVYEHCWAEGTWHPFDTYGGVYPFFAWFSSVAFHCITAYLDEMGYIKVMRERTPKNTKLLLGKHSPEGCLFIINEVMPNDECKNLLLDIYVEKKQDAEIMQNLQLDEEKYKEIRNAAEELFKFRIINSTYNFEDYVIAESSARDITISIDNVYPWEFSFDTTTTHPLVDVFPSFGDKADISSNVNSFIMDVIRFLKWNEIDTYVFLRRWDKVPAADVAREIGKSRDWVNTRFSRLRQEFRAFIRYWWSTHCE